MYNIRNTLGLDENHVTNIKLGNKPDVLIHHHAVDPLRELWFAASCAGFDLAIASGFRTFERQRNIWNAKALGQRVVLAANETPLDIFQLTPSELLKAILHWSALPGGSRHHWGSDFDIYCCNALPTGQTLELTVAETESIFKEFYSWLEDYLGGQSEFIRPFNHLGAVIAREPWHLSYAPVACEYQKLLSAHELLASLRDADVELFEVIEVNFNNLFSQYIEAFYIVE